MFTYLRQPFIRLPYFLPTKVPSNTTCKLVFYHDPERANLRTAPQGTRILIIASLPRAATESGCSLANSIENKMDASLQISGSIHNEMPNVPSNESVQKTGYISYPSGFHGFLLDCFLENSILRQSHRLNCSNQPLHQNDQDQDGQNELEVGSEPLFQLDADAGVGLGKVVLGAPAPFGDAEQQVDQGANG